MSDDPNVPDLPWASIGIAIGALWLGVGTAGWFYVTSGASVYAHVAFIMAALSGWLMIVTVMRARRMIHEQKEREGKGD